MAGSAILSNVNDHVAPSYLVLSGHLFVGEVGDRHLVVDGLPDLVLGSLAGLAGVEQVAQRLVVYFNKACCEIELRKSEELLNKKQRGFGEWKNVSSTFLECEDSFS